MAIMGLAWDVKSQVSAAKGKVDDWGAECSFQILYQD